MGAKSLKRDREQTQQEPDVEAPPKRRREAGDTQLSKLYEELAAESDETRLEAAKQIIVKFSPENEPSAPAVEKALNRLILGLCSARKAARFGFCVTLTELLRSLFREQEDTLRALDLDLNGIISLVVDKTKVEGNVPGKARRDQFIGRLFGYKAIIQSGILLEPKLSLDCWNTVLDHIYELARDIPWLREECGLILVEVIKSLDDRPELRTCVQELIQRLVSFNLANTPEGVAIWLTAKDRFEDILPKDIWNKQDPLYKKEWSRLAKVLKEDFRSTSENGEKENIKSSGANPNPIFAWDLVLAEMLKRDLAKKDQKDTAKPEFPQFWLEVVDNNLFSSTVSHERKAWGFKLFATQVRTVPDGTLPALFSPNLMRSLINQSKKDNRFLHAAALAALNAIQARVQEEPSSAMSIFVAMTTKTGTIDLDRITKTKTLENVMIGADDDTLRKIVRHLQTIVLRPETQEQATADSRRHIIADMLLNIVKNYKRYEGANFGEEHDTWLRKLLDVMVENAYFIPSAAAKTSKVPLPPLSDATRKVFQERLSSCLTRLLTVETESRTNFALMAVGMIRSKATSSKSLELVFKADESILQTVDKAFKTMEGIAAKGSKSGKESAAQGFILLYSLALLQVYDGDGDAILLLDDLDSARKTLLKGKKSSSSQGQDTFVEILLTFLGNPRTLFRKIAQEAFTIFASDLTEAGLQSLTDILDTPESLDGQNELFNQGGDAMDAGSDDGADDDVEDVEEDSDVEMINGEPTDSDEDDSEEEGSSSSESADDDDEEDEELTKFDQLLALTLQTSKPSMDDDAASDTSDGSDMDDEQMMALDPHLTKIFQERSKLSSKKKERTDAKETVVQFKSRVLDLLAIFLDKQYSNPLTLEVLLPLLRRIRAGGNKQLTDRSYKLLKSYTDTRTHHKAPLPKPENLDGVWEILKAIHEETKKGGGSTLHATACSTASLHVVKVLVGADPANYSQVVDVYAEAQKEWFMDKKSAVQPTIFTQFLNWSMSVQKQTK